MSAATAPPPPQQLVLQKEVFTAYLQPLLKKHELQQILTYEDLTASWQAAMAVLGNNKVADSGTKTAVVRRALQLFFGSNQSFSF
jgi:hypothetical protein